MTTRVVQVSRRWLSGYRLFHCHILRSDIVVGSKACGSATTMDVFKIRGLAVMLELGGMVWRIPADTAPLTTDDTLSMGRRTARWNYGGACNLIS